MITEELRKALAASSSRVTDLFKDWDATGDGVIRKREFRQGLRTFGLNVAAEEIDKLFNEWDTDKTGGGPH